MHGNLAQLTVTAAVVLAALAPAASALAADASGCSGTVVSISADRSVLGRATAPGSGGTQENPLVVDPAGTIAWTGSTTALITQGTWSVSALGVTVLSGDFANTEKKTSAKGTTDLSTIAPLKILLTGNTKIPVSGSITGTGGSCTASGYVAGTGSATSSPLFWAGGVLTIVGLLLAISVLSGTKAAAATAATAAVTSGGAAS
jgi:hypothetical protein